MAAVKKGYSVSLKFILPLTSMAEGSAVNRLVVGSSPAEGAIYGLEDSIQHFMRDSSLFP